MALIRLPGRSPVTVLYPMDQVDGAASFIGGRDTGSLLTANERLIFERLRAAVEKHILVLWILGWLFKTSFAMPLWLFWVMESLLFISLGYGFMGSLLKRTVSYGGSILEVVVGQSFRAVSVGGAKAIST